MGLFDAFTGAPADDAADKNRALLQSNQTSGTNTLNQGQTQAIGALGQAGGIYGGLASKYGKGTDLYLNSLGVNGQAGNDAATAAFHAAPGYQYSVDQALQGINRAGAVGGAGLNGNTLAALSDRAGNMADQQYGQWQSQLAGLISPEVTGTTGQAGATAAQAPVYQNTAQNIANLGTNTTNNLASQNTQQANADMAANANLWNFGLNAAKAVASGGTSLLGGGSGGGGGGGGLAAGQAFNNPNMNSSYYGPLN